MEDEAQTVVLALELADHDVVGVDRLGERLQVADRAGLAKGGGVADDAEPIGGQLRQPGHDQVRQTGHEAVEGRVAGLVEDRHRHNRLAGRGVGAHPDERQDHQGRHPGEPRSAATEPGLATPPLPAGRVTYWAPALTRGRVGRFTRACHRWQEAEAALGQGLHEPRVLAGVAERGTHLGQAIRQAAVVVHVRVLTPNRRPQLLARDDLAGPGHQHRQCPRRLRLESWTGLPSRVSSREPLSNRNVPRRRSSTAARGLGAGDWGLWRAAVTLCGTHFPSRARASQ